MTMTERRVGATGLRPGDTFADGTVIDTSPFVGTSGFVIADVITPDGDRESRHFRIGADFTVFRRYSGDVW
jgi:hypothetical protein